VGANIGAMSLVAASCCRQVIAFEPAPATFQLLKQHIERNQVTNIIPLELALSEQTGTVNLHISSGSNTGMTSMLATDETWESISARSDTVDRLVSEQKIPAPTVMKIDVEGAEHLVLTGARETLRSPSLRYVVFEARSDKTHAIADLRLDGILTSAGFRLQRLGILREENDGLDNFLAVKTPAQTAAT
jgi:FkbM family methyltransferase